MKTTEKCSKSMKVTKLTLKEITNNFNKNPKQQTEIIILDSFGRKNISIRSDFTNILREAFTQTDPKSAKKTDGLTVFFVLLGSARIKGFRKMLVKSTPAILFFSRA